MATVDTSPENLTYLEDQAKQVQGQLQSSPTAYADNVTPSSSDISLGTKLDTLTKNISAVRSSQLRNEWYGPQNTQTTSQESTQADQTAPQSHNWIVSGLSALQKPLNAIVGAEQFALGKGTSSTLFGNINDALKEGLTSGDVLKQYGVNRAVQIPLGFMLDVFQDPINWVTAGTDALIPRVGVGLVKGATEGGVEGGLEAAKTGLVSGLERKLAKILPYKATSAVADTAEAAGDVAKDGMLNKFSNAYRNFTSNVGASAIENSDKYDELIKSNVYDRLGKNWGGLTDLNEGNTVGKWAESAIRSLPHGDDIADFFKYSTQDRIKSVNLLDQVYQLGKTQGAIMTNDLHGKDVLQDISELLKPGSPITIPDKIAEITKNTLSEGSFIEPVKVANSFENAQKLLDFAAQDKSLKNLISYDPEVLKDAYTTIRPGTTGVAGYDNVFNRLRGVVDKEGNVLTPALSVGDVLDKINAGTLAKNMGIYDTVKDWTPFKTILDANDRLLGLFKLFKVPASLSAHFFAWTGNLTMGWQMGIPIEDPEFLRGLASMRSYLGGGQTATFMKNTFLNDVNSWVDYMDNHPNLFRQMAGFNPSTIDKQLGVGQKILTQYGTTQSEVTKVLAAEYENIVSGHDQLSNLIRLEQKADKTEEDIKTLNELKRVREANPPESSIQTVQQMNKDYGGTIPSSAKPSGFGSNELVGNSNWMDTLKARIEDGASDTTKPAAEQAAYKAANLIMNKMPNWYEKIDQSYKLETTHYLSVKGVPESNLIKISRQVPITKDDIVSSYVSGGQKLYRLTPEKASEVAIETFMNYSAMPDFVKVMRTLPIVGSPFLSFSYATAAKAGKTLINDPAFFNKVAFLINEISDVRTPQEKEALTQKYNEYLNSPTMIKLGDMFGTSWNTDVKTMLPYLTMNMLNSSQKNYDNSFPSDVVRAIDASPFMKHPLGQLMFDYLIQPSILNDSTQVPETQFGEPLYPSYDANGNLINPGIGTKAFYAARTGAESLMPGITAYAGLAKVLGIPDSVMNAVPSFGARQVGYATEGKNTIGAATKENPIQKTLRAISARSGLSLYPLNPTTTNKTNQ